MMTSYWAKVKAVKAAGLEPVGISVKPPFWWGKKGRNDLRLAPSVEMLKMSREEYDIIFTRQLAALDPREIAASLPENACLICWERANTWCHRRAVAEWLETSLGLIIPEFGLARADSLKYVDLPEK